MLHLKDKTAAGLQEALENYFMNCTLPFETITFDNGRCLCLNSINCLCYDRSLMPIAC